MLLLLLLSVVEPAFVAAKGRVVGVVWCLHQLLWWRRDATAPSTVHVVVCPLRRTERGEGWSGGRVDEDGVVAPRHSFHQKRTNPELGGGGGGGCCLIFFVILSHLLLSSSSS